MFNIVPNQNYFHNKMTDMVEILLSNDYGGFRINSKFIKKYNELNQDKTPIAYTDEDEEYADQSSMYIGTTCLCVVDGHIDDKSDIHGNELRLRTDKFFIDLVKQNIDISVSNSNISICQIPKIYFDSGCFKILNNEGVEVMQILTYKYQFQELQKTLS